MANLVLTPLTALVLGPLLAFASLIYTPPVEAPIVDHFRPPACTWCPGNRGIDYATSPGTPVRAAAGGIVTFAGAIGPDRFVTIAHPDGLRTSYAYLASIGVRAGQRVAAGTLVGVSAGRVHFGVRRGDTYLDPELLFRSARLVARLVPLDGRHSRPRRATGPVRAL
jgi:murein DD-endopeptidase MepM/ murein hydrolase activator NlpD